MTTDRSHALKQIAILATAALIAVAFSHTALADDEAAAAFKSRCGECHGTRDIQHWGRQRPDAAAREAWLDQFLRRHYPPPEARRALVLRHIQSTLAGLPR